MNTLMIILISVLSTLGAVGLITSIVVAFKKISKRVEIEDYYRYQEDLSRSLDERFKDLEETLLGQVRINGECIDEVRTELHSKIDSRYDKLKNELDSSNTHLQGLVRSHIMVPIEK